MNFFLYALAFHVCILYMASGSGSHGHGDESSWLDLGLGIGLGPNYPFTATPSTTTTAAQHSSSLLPSLPWGHHQSLPWGHHQSLLGLGICDDGVRRPAGAMHHCDGWHYNSLANLPSSSSSIFPNASLFLSSGRVRPEVGLWFSLVALPGWRRESGALPQISKAYIRVKDENMTILMVKKYLVRKLGLVGEFEIEISCMGVKLSNSQTLRHVRDTVWIQGLEQSLSSVESFHPSLHLMSLRYSKS